MKKACDKYKFSDSIAYLQNKMSREEESQFQFHMMGCPHCQRRVANLRRVVNMLSINTMPIKRIWLSAASVVIIVGASMTFWRSSTGGSESLEINYAEPHILHSSEGEGDSYTIDTTNMSADSIRNNIDSLRGDSLIIIEIEE